MTKGSKTQYAILGALSIQPMSGYEIKKMMEETTNHFWTESNGQLYPTLNKLEKNKLVTVDKQMVGAKLRKIYTISIMGKNFLKKWLLDDPEYYPARNEFMLKLFYGQNVPPNISINHIKKHGEKCQKALKIYIEIEKQLEEMVKQKKRPVYFLLTVKAGINIVRAEIDWCKESIELITKYH
jgi:DNA-binding PadR family transcriptional regulator